MSKIDIDERIDRMIEKYTSEDELTEEGPPDSSTRAFDKYTARTTSREEPREEKKESYDDWLKRQPKSNVIGIHKRKKR